MVTIALLMAAQAVSPALQRLADIQVAAGMCEGRLTPAQRRQLDPFADRSVPAEVRAMMGEARLAGQRLGRGLPALTGPECTKLLRGAFHGR